MDVDRTFQKLDFFRQVQHKSILENILFVWSMNNTLGYRQGMNEIVAVIVYYGLIEEETIDSLSSREHIEPDSYAIFDKLIELGLGKFYESVDYIKIKHDSLSEIPTVDRSREEDLAISIRRCHYIFHRILANVDNELYQHIFKHKYEPQLFLLRWLRCLLCREFSITEIGHIWDVIFCLNPVESKELEVVNYFCIAVLVKSRDLCRIYIVLKNSSSELLQTLMKPMIVKSIPQLVELAAYYFRTEAGKKYPIPSPRANDGILPKIFGFITGKSPQENTQVLRRVIVQSPLEEALENINRTIEIVENAKIR